MNQKFVIGILALSALFLTACHHDKIIPLPYNYSVSIPGERWERGKWGTDGISIYISLDSEENIKKADELALAYCWRHGLDFNLVSIKMTYESAYIMALHWRRRYECVGG